MSNLLIFNFMQSQGSFLIQIGMLYAKKNHGGFVFLIEFDKEVLAIYLFSQPSFPHNLFSVWKFLWGKEYKLQECNTVIGCNTLKHKQWRHIIPNG